MTHGDSIPPGSCFNGILRAIPLAELDEVWQLDLRCFVDGEAYERETFSYLLSNPNAIARQIRADDGPMAAFIVAIIELDGVGHITAIGVAPEYRRQGLARILLKHIEQIFRERQINTIRLEVRVENIPAISLYEELGYTVVQRLPRYYSNGNDGYMMVKSI
ncbi:MAG: ribosomal-protein-alanine N-acetyltransferase [Acidobacteria bacterium]|nr:ribosomal-protein-alanine N-acetyltransferase [Acidobacteriota bacterium]